MAQVEVLDKVDDPPGTDIIVAVAADHSVVLFDETKFEAWLRAKREAAPSGLDMDKAKDRGAIKSYVDKLRTDRANIKRDRLRLTEEWRTSTAKVNEAGKRIDAEIGDAIDDILEPVLAWEEIEKKRIAECEAIIAGFREAARERLDDTSDAARQRGKDVWGTAIDPERFGSLAEAARTAKDDAVAALKVTLARLVKEEADRAELEKLRAEKEERDAQDAAEREAREQAEREAEQARIAKEREEAAALAEKERLAAIERAAEERVRREAEQAAQAERDRIQRAHDAELQAERDRIAELERIAAAAEELRIAEERRAERDRQQAEEARQRAAEQTRRDEANKALQRRLAAETIDAIMLHGVADVAAQNIVRAIRAGIIPNVVWEVRK